MKWLRDRKHEVQQQFVESDAEESDVEETDSTQSVSSVEET
jgi:hypothetical protein